jgi:hypothetical protein
MQKYAGLMMIMIKIGNYKPDIMRQKYYKQIQIANADSINNWIRQWNKSCQQAQYWLKNNTQKDTIQCVLNCTVTYARKTGIQLDNEHWYDHVLYQNQSQQVMKVRLPYYGTNKCEPTDMFLPKNCAT